MIDNCIYVDSKVRIQIVHTRKTTVIAIIALSLLEITTTKRSLSDSDYKIMFLNRFHTKKMLKFKL